MQYFVNLHTRLQASLWLIPAVMCAAMAGLAYALVFSPLEIPGLSTSKHWWLFSGDAATARDLMSTILSGIITMTSLVVSITMVVLSLASAQLGPRLIDNFLRDRQIQVVLGLFTGTVFYCLFVLRSINEELGAKYVPQIAITTGTFLAMLCLFALLFYVHKVARSIVADTVVAQVADSLESAILRDARQEQSNPLGQHRKYALRTSLSLGQSGYVQVTELDRLVSLATRKNIFIELAVRPGHFVLRKSHTMIVSSDAPLRENTLKAIRHAFTVGQDRTPTQDLEYSVRQLVEIAVRALSPGINDPFTAIAVINRLAAALELAAFNVAPVRQHTDGTGEVRVQAIPSDLKGLFDTAFNHIRQAAQQSPAVLIQLAHVYGQLAAVLHDTESRSSLLAHMQKISRAGQQNIEDPSDLSDFIAAAASGERTLKERQHRTTEAAAAAAAALQ